MRFIKALLALISAIMFFVVIAAISILIHGVVAESFGSGFADVVVLFTALYGNLFVFLTTYDFLEELY